VADWNRPGGLELNWRFGIFRFLSGVLEFSQAEGNVNNSDTCEKTGDRDR
jgi:hypothetical protein